MCYSAQISASAKQIARELGIPWDEALKIANETFQTWNSAFTLPLVPILMESGAKLATWTFLEPGIKDLKEARQQPARTANCRADEMFTKATFMSAAKKSRCIVVLDAYFEYQRRGTVRVPFKFRRPDGSPFLVGGVAGRWLEGRWTFAICTTEPNSLNRWVHNSRPRQPVLVEAEKARTWLRAGGPEVVAEFLIPADDGYLVAEECKGPNGKWPPDTPLEPPGAPPGILRRQRTDTFGFEVEL